MAKIVIKRRLEPMRIRGTKLWVVEAVSGVPMAMAAQHTPTITNQK